MKDYIKLIDGLPQIIKIILALPGLDNIVYGIYRIAKGNVIIGLLWLIFGGWVLCIIDIYTLLTVNKITFLA
ncbi:MAG: hypothetical protein PHC62_09390 [Candidatus Izemoplasmatales bacterium]|jgi:hypothetical protein|nr:hypothetical protein [Candidatus Izemoplasmatales bacterium]